MAKSKKNVNDKMLGIMIGIALTISAIGIISAVSISYTHGRDANDMMGHDMMSGDMMMHSMMMDEQGNMIEDSTDTMNCMSMMKDHKMTQEEIDEMMKSMDKDGDGLCDYCGMSVAMCRNMMSL